MEQSLLILGRQPAIGLAELESLYGVDKLRPVPAAGVPIAALLDSPTAGIDFRRLGGSLKLARVLMRVDTTDWERLQKPVRAAILQLLPVVPQGKLKVGISAYGFDITVAKLNASGLSLKKIIRNADSSRSVRIVPNKELELNSAQVQHNGLTTATGWELLLVRDGARSLIALTTDIQDIDAYAARDQGRPKRDARVGMLPPKLAQTIVNLATGNNLPQGGTIILDPFCGTGVVLQEALLMGYDVYGSDLEPRMVDYTTQNLDWLGQDHTISGTIKVLEVADATSHRWQSAAQPTIVACEGYLGQPFTVFPSGDKLAEIRNTCNQILRKFLQNIAGQLPSGSRLCIAVPAWQQKPGQFVHLAVLGSAHDSSLDHLEDMGYNRVSFKHVEPDNLIYARADQIVARELLVVTKV